MPRTSTCTSPPQTSTADLDEGTGAASIEKLGAVTTQLLTDWLTRFAAAGTKITLRPVLDLNSDQAVDQHDPPDAMRETVVLRDAHCVFPGCGRDSRACDLDHITEYLPMEDGGPPGQTRPANLAPLCRTHHRAKTHTAWHYKRLDDGSYQWTAPTGHQYRVTPASRLTPDRADRPSLWLRPLDSAATALVSSDRSLRSLLDHLWLPPPHASRRPRWLRSERSERLETDLPVATA